MHNKKNTKKGISLVISLIMMTLLLSLSFSISNIILRQIRLTNTSTNSQTSFYAADSGLECALYHDTHSDGTVPSEYNSPGNAYFGTSSSWTTGANPIQCGVRNGYTPMGYDRDVSADETIATTTFSIDYGNACALVEVVKTPYRTKISSSGYNVGANDDFTGCDLNDAVARRVVERGIVFSH